MARKAEQMTKKEEIIQTNNRVLRLGLSSHCKVSARVYTACVCMSEKAAKAAHGLCRSFHAKTYCMIPGQMCTDVLIHINALCVYICVSKGGLSHGSYSVTKPSTVLTCTKQSRVCRRVQLLHAQSVSQLKPKHSCSYLLYLNQRGKVLLSFRNTCL